MFFHDKRLHYDSKPDRPDPVYAKKLQEILGGQFGEMTVMIQYLFQGWNCRGPAKYRDMLLDIGTEEIAHVEMLAVMIARLLETAPIAQEEAAKNDPIMAAVLGGTVNPQHIVINGLGSRPDDSQGYPFNSRYCIQSGNLLADFRSNLAAESQGRLQAVRLYELTDDPGVKDMLSFLIARDTMHQNQWMAAIEDIEREQLEMTPVPSSFSRDLEKQGVSYQFQNWSRGTESADGRWAKGKSLDGNAEFEYVANPEPLGPELGLEPVNPLAHGTGTEPRLATANV